MSTEKNRVYIEDAKEAPDDAIVRRGKRGRLYYRTDERGQNNEVGGNHENSLLEDGVDKQNKLREGEVFYDTENETEVVIAEVDGDNVQVTTGSHEWTESAQSAMNNIENGSWVHLPDEQRTVERQEDDPCWEGYEMVGTKVQDGEEVPNCVPKSDVERAVAEMDNPTKRDVLERFNAQVDEKQEDEDPCWEGYEMVGMKPNPDGEGKVPNCVPEDEVENAEKLAEKDGTFGKPFEGPNGQGPFNSFTDCVEHMEDEVDNPEGLCATWHHEDTGEWPGEKSDTLELSDSVPDDVVVKVYVKSATDVPEGHIIERDSNGLFFRQQAFDLAAATYPEDMVEEYGYEMPEAEGDEEADDPPTEEQYQENLHELFDDLEERYDGV